MGSFFFHVLLRIIIHLINWCPNNCVHLQFSQPSVAVKDQDFLDANVLVTGDTDYSNVEIGDLNEERSEMSTLSHSSSIETLLSIKSISPKHLPHSLGASRGSIQHDMNGNPEYDQTELDESDTRETSSPAPQPSSASKIPASTLDIGSQLDSDEIPLVYVLRLLCKNFLLQGQNGALISDRQVRVSLKSLALGCITSIFTLCPRLVLLSLSPSCSTLSSHNSGSLLSIL